MPRISEFNGIEIYIYYAEHGTPHFHAIYAEYKAKFSIETGDVIRGELPRRARRLVRQWVSMHRDELMANWESARSAGTLMPIEPLP